MAKWLQQCFCLWWQNRHCLVKFRKCQRLCLFCLMMQKHGWNFFAFNQSCWRQNSFSSGFASWGKIKTHGFTWADQDWSGLMIFKNFADQHWIGFNFIGSGLDSNWKISQSAHLWCLCLLCDCSVVLLSPFPLAWLEEVTPLIGMLLMYFFKKFRVYV